MARDSDELVRICSDTRSAARALAQPLAPDADDYRVRKPRRSAFFGTPLEFLLEELGTRMLIIAGIAADNCLPFTASDAYVRKYRLWISSPRAANPDTPRRSSDSVYAGCWVTLALERSWQPIQAACLTSLP